MAGNDRQISGGGAGESTDAGGFELCSEARPARSAKLTKQQEEIYSQRYGKKWRQIRRWIDRGEQTGDRCPLDEPAKMPGWWARNMVHRVPEEIERAAVEASRVSAEAVVPDEVKAPAEASEPKSKAIDLEQYDPEEGDRLRELKQIQAARFEDLRERLRRGEDCSSLESKYLKLCETIDKIETRVTERLKKRGLYILKAEVEADLAAAAELLRQAQGSMVRRVLELCPSLADAQRFEVQSAIERARATEQRMLSRIDSLDGEDLLNELRAS